MVSEKQNKNQQMNNLKDTSQNMSSISKKNLGDIYEDVATDEVCDLFECCK